MVAVKYIAPIICFLLLNAYFVVKYILYNKKAFQVNWENGDWSYHCTFQGKNLIHVSSPDQKNCSNRCVTIRACTHYSWSKGVCSIKTGVAHKSDALLVEDDKDFCGIISHLGLASV